MPHILDLSTSFSERCALESIVSCKFGQIQAGIRPFKPYWTATDESWSRLSAQSRELDTNAFLLDLAKFSRIWGGGGLIFYVKTSS